MYNKVKNRFKFKKNLTFFKFFKLKKIIDKMNALVSIQIRYNIDWKLAAIVGVSGVVIYTTENYYVAIGIGALLLKKYVQHKKNENRKSYPENILILHQFLPGKITPSMSPFCLRLETWYSFRFLD